MSLETAMRTERQSRKSPVAASLAETQGAVLEAKGNGPCVYLIRIAAKEDRVRALRAFRRVRSARIRFPGHVMGVTEEHLHVLTAEKIEFEYLSKASHGEEENAKVQP
jgi:hypothetical protein